jgi:O-antigen ligase
LNEYLDRPLHLIFGDGRYAVRTLKAAIQGWMLPVGHPHNMFIELIIDVGLVGFGIILSFYIYLMRKLQKSIAVDQNPQTKEYKIAILVSIIAFLFSGLTDRSFFPNLENCFLWTVLACGYKMLYIQDSSNSSIIPFK